MRFKKNNIKYLMLIAAFIFIPDILLGAGISVSRAETLMENIRDALFALAAISVTVVIAYVAYQVMVQGQAIQKMTPVIVGGLLIATASAIGGMFTGISWKYYGSKKFRNTI